MPAVTATGTRLFPFSIMKINKFIALSLLVPCAAVAQNKIDMAGLQMINDYRAQQLSKSRALTHEPVIVTKSIVPSVVMAIVTVDSPTALEEIERKGGKVVSVRADIAIVEMPIDNVEAVAAIPQVRGISFGNEAEAKLNYARRDSYVNPVQTGTEGLPQAFTGKGVVAGLMDTGLDPNHVNFTGRVSRVWVVNPGAGTNTVVQAYDTPAKIAAFKTENSAKTHGTHVLGIMAGAYNSTGRYGTYSTSGNYMVGTSKIPYYGVAKEADIAIGCGSLAEACILRAGDLVTEYAQSVNRPAVYNLSLGNNIGPHDGTDATSRYLAEIGKEAIICISAGNEGESRMSFEQEFSSSTTEYRTLIAGTESSACVGAVDLWSANNSEFSVTFVIYDTQTSSVMYSYELNRNTGGADVSIANPNYSGNNINSDDFDTAMIGYVILRSNVATYNNRYQTYIYTNLTPRNPRYIPGFIVKGQPGVKVSGFCSSALEFNGRGIAGYQSGSAINSANGMACGENVIVIGSYNTRDKIPTMSGSFQQGYPLGDTSPFSSYGVEPNGRSLPDLCAPGLFVISSISTPYVEAKGLGTTEMSAMTPYPASTSASVRNNYWEQMSGTSMASPFAAGVVMLMLEADPTLTVNEVRDILTSTAIRDEQVTSAANQVKWGAGKLDALSAMKKVLKIDAAIGHVRPDDAERLIVTSSDDAVNLFVAGETSMKASLFTPAGVAVASAAADADELTLPTAGLNSGIYVLTVEGSTGRFSQKIIIK